MLKRFFTGQDPTLISALLGVGLMAWFDPDAGSGRWVHRWGISTYLLFAQAASVLFVRSESGWAWAGMLLAVIETTGLPKVVERHAWNSAINGYVGWQLAQDARLGVFFVLPFACSTLLSMKAVRPALNGHSVVGRFTVAALIYLLALWSINLLHDRFLPRGGRGPVELARVFLPAVLWPVVIWRCVAWNGPLGRAWAVSAFAGLLVYHFADHWSPGLHDGQSMVLGGLLVIAFTWGFLAPLSPASGTRGPRGFEPLPLPADDGEDQGDLRPPEVNLVE